MSNPKKPGQLPTGIEAVADMLNHLTADERARILANVAKADPKIAQEIEEQLQGFEHLVELEDRSLQIFLRDIPQSTLALALRTVNEEFKRRVFAAISERGRLTLLEEIALMGPQKTSKVQAAQQQIARLMKEALEAGKIFKK